MILNSVSSDRTTDLFEELMSLKPADFFAFHKALDSNTAPILKLANRAFDSYRKLDSDACSALRKQSLCRLKQLQLQVAKACHQQVSLMTDIPIRNYLTRVSD